MKKKWFKKPKYLTILIVPILIIFFDQWTKAAITSSFRLGESLVIIPGYFNLSYVRNPGAAFGLFAQAPAAFRIPFFLLIPVIALFVIGYIFKKTPDDSFRLSTALSLVTGGAIGNLIDRVRFGYVVDFLDFHWNFKYHFPAFNIADSTICIGVGILMLDILLEPEKDEKNASSST